MIILEANDTLSAIASAATAITVTGYGMEKASSNIYKKLFQTQAAASATTIYTAPAATEVFLKTIIATNPTGTARTLRLYHDGTNDATTILPAISIVAGGMALYADGRWTFYTAAGGQIMGGVSSIAGTAAEITASAASGDVTLSLPTALTFTGKTVTGGTFASPTLQTPALGTPASGVATNLTGTASGLTAGLATDTVTKTGTGSTYVTNTSPTITTPVIVQIVPGADFSLSQNSVTPFVSVNSGAIANTLRLDAGKVFIQATSNTKMTTGFTIKQAAGVANEVIAFKAASLIHGITSATETDTYYSVNPIDVTNGGADISGYSAATRAFRLLGTGVTDDTTKSTAAVGYINFLAGKKSGTSIGIPGADANMVVFLDGGATARFIFDVEGTAHADVAWTTFQDHDDIGLLKNTERELTKGQHTAGQLPSLARKELISLGIVGADSIDAKGQPARGLTNMTKLAMLQTGAIRQAHDIVDLLLDDLMARRPLTANEKTRIPMGIKLRKAIQ